MAFKINRYHKDHLFWIYPLVFIGLTFYAIAEDRHDRESSAMTGSNAKADTSLSMSNLKITGDSLRINFRIKQSGLLMGN
jgi:hypothetical protein